MLHKNQGFTLIELVMVIVILGILGGVALPKFFDMSQKARVAALKTGHGAILTAMTIVHSKAVIDGKESLASSSVDLEGETIDIAYGYPKYGNVVNSPIVTAAGLDTSVYHANMTINGRTYITLTINRTTSSSACAIRYTEATATSIPVVDDINTSGFFGSFICRA